MALRKDNAVTKKLTFAILAISMSMFTLFIGPESDHIGYACDYNSLTD